MKKAILFLCFLLPGLTLCSQDRVQLKRVIREGNSEKGFEFVRNVFRLPASEDPYLHFKARGIRQLISFCDHRNRRIEATSMIRFHQTREFWTNYSRQFTAGKWHYRQLYKTDSLAWLAANYSILLIYAHEMGHYMSRRFKAETDNVYTCEEVIADESLAAFAHAFDGDPEADRHRDLFIELARQTCQHIPDTEKTPYAGPMHQWCASDPMNSFFQFYEKEEEKFLRLYGYSQYKMMEEALVNYQGGSWKAFLDREFYDFFRQFTGKQQFSPLPYRILAEKDITGQYGAHIYYEKEKTGSLSYFRASRIEDWLHSIDTKGDVFMSHFSDEWQFSAGQDTLTGIDSGFYRHFLSNQKWIPGSAVSLNHTTLADSAYGLSWDMLSALPSRQGFSFLIRHIDLKDTTRKRKREWPIYYYHLTKGKNAGSFRFALPDSLVQDPLVAYQEIGMAAIPGNGEILLTNALTRDNRHRLSLYLMDTANRQCGPLIWQGEPAGTGFFNIMYPTLFLDTVAQSIDLCFYNPVSEKIHLIRIGKNESGAYELYRQGNPGQSGPQLKVRGLQLRSGNQLYILARTRQPGNHTKEIFKSLLVQWPPKATPVHKD